MTNETKQKLKDMSVEELIEWLPGNLGKYFLTITRNGKRWDVDYFDDNSTSIDFGMAIIDKSLKQALLDMATYLVDNGYMKGII